MKPLSPAHIAQMRRCQESIMTSEAEIRQPGVRAYDPVSRRDRYSPGELVYAGRARLQPVSAHTYATPGGGETVIRPRYVGAVPWGTPGIEPGQIITLTKTTAARGTERRYMITSVERGDGPAATALRFHAELLDERTTS